MFDRSMLRAYMGKSPVIPISAYVDESAQVVGDVVLGENASIWMCAVVRGDVHHVRIGANSNIQDNSVLHGMLGQWPVEVGEWVTVGHNVTLHGCVVEDRCLIGMGAIILNGARIGAGSIIAAGTLIPEGAIVEPGSLWMGVPGKFKKKLADDEQQTILRYAKNYLGYKNNYLAEQASVAQAYKARFPKGSFVQVLDRASLERFRTEWRFHHPLAEDQLSYANVVALVSDVAFYHGGDVLYHLDAVPGIWHEQCLRAPATPQG